jgi:uncharacterized protein YggE
MVPGLRWAALALPVALVAGAATLPRPATVAGTPSSALTVVGYGVANLPPAPPIAQLNVSFQVTGQTASSALSRLNHDVALIRSRLMQHGVKASAITVNGPPNLGLVTSSIQQACQRIAKLKHITCPSPGFSAQESLTVNFPTITALAAVYDQADIGTMAGINNIWINGQAGTAPPPSSSALAQAYRAAFQNAAATARLLAAADHLALAGIQAVDEGQAAFGQCPGCPGTPLLGANPPQVGPNQQEVAVTVTYRTVAAP